MASEGAISSCLCLITCSRVLGECSTFWLRPPFQNGGKIFGKGCLRAGKLKFFQIFAFAGERIFPSQFGIGPKCSVISASIAEERVQKVPM